MKMTIEADVAFEELADHEARAFALGNPEPGVVQFLVAQDGKRCAIRMTPSAAKDFGCAWIVASHYAAAKAAAPSVSRATGPIPEETPTRPRDVTIEEMLEVIERKDKATP